ncbi:MAG: glycosyltransferase family 4 protein [Acidobacteriota bacterium]
MTRPRVLVVGPVPPPFGGMPRYVQDLLEGDLRERVDLHHFNTAFSPRWRPQGFNPGHGRWQPGRETGWSKYAYLFASGWRGGLGLLAGAAVSFLRFAFRLSTCQPDVVHVVSNMHWGYWRNGIYVLLARVGGAKVIFHPLGAIDQFHDNSGRAGRWAISAFLNLADLVLVQSTGVAHQVSAMTTAPVRALFNGIHLEPLAGAAAGRVFRPSQVTFLAVGDLGHNKGTFDILQAAGAVAREVPDARWRFIGRGDLGDLRRRAGEAGLGGRVLFHGPVGEDEKLEAYAGSDVFLLPSYAEGQPLSILEAMAAGLPVISTTVGSIPEIVGRRNGLLIEPGDLPALEASMRKLAGEPGLRASMSAANLQAARARFDVHRLHRELLDTYRDLAPDRGPAEGDG